MNAGQLAEEWIIAMNARDVERMAALLTEDAVGDEVAESEPRRGVTGSQRATAKSSRDTQTAWQR
jgi:ketosteroid isomerase-like protein